MSERKYLDDYERGCEDTREELQPEIERLEKALEVYGWHTDRCQYPDTDKRCSCGFTAALRGESGDE